MIVVFDAQCLLCCRSVQFLLRHDHRARLRYASVQDDAGRRLLEAAGVDALAPDTFLLVDGDRTYTRSRALIEVMHALGGRWRLGWLLWPIPAPLRDAAYLWVARHRTHWFGRTEACWLPSAEYSDRFIRLPGTRRLP